MQEPAPFGVVVMTTSMLAHVVDIARGEHEVGIKWGMPYGSFEEKPVYWPILTRVEPDGLSGTSLVTPRPRPD